MPEAFKVDRLGLRFLAQPQKNGRMTNVDLADAAGLSPSPCPEEYFGDIVIETPFIKTHGPIERLFPEPR
jgi:hypothetical protein